MAGISSNALRGTNYQENRLKYNGIEFANKEFNDGSGLEMYEAYFRNLDPQIGRWWQIDLRPNYSFSPYASMDLNPIKNKDFYGDTTIPVNNLPGNWPNFNPNTDQVQLNTVTITASKSNNSNSNATAIPIGLPLPMESPITRIPPIVIPAPNPILLTIALVLLPANLGQPNSDHIPRVIVPNVPIPSAEDLPWTPGISPGKDWVWKGKGTPESGVGNWVNPNTGQKLHPDFNHPLPKGPHGGVKQPDGSK